MTGPASTIIENRKVASDNWYNYVRARDSGFLEYVKDAQKFDRFYLGDQWDKGLRQNLESQGKPVLTLNIIMSAVKAALSVHSSHRVDPQLKPRLEADEDGARIMTQVLDQILAANHYPAVETLVFTDGMVQDRGYLDVRMDFSSNLYGDVKVTALDPVDVVIDPDAKEYDPSTWNQVFLTRWHTIDEVEVLYGKDKADEIRGLASAGQTLGYDSVRMDVIESRFGDSQYPQYIYTAVQDSTGTIRNVRVIERQHRVLTKVRQFVDLETGDLRDIPSEWTPERIEEVRRQFNLGVREVTKKRVRWTVTIDFVVLFDDWSPYDRFTIIPYFPVFRRGKSSGTVRQLISPQEQLNKVESQSLHVVNTTANSGWITHEGSLVNMTSAELESRGAETGLMIEVRKGAEAPQKIQPNQIPTGLDRIGTKAASFVREISGMQNLMAVAPEPEASGVTLEGHQRISAGLLQSSLDNLAFTRTWLVEAIIALVQEFYTEPRILKVTDWRKPEQPEVELAVNQPDPIGGVLNDLTLGTYEVVISTAPARDSLMDSQFAEALQLREVGVHIPDDYVIRYSHLAQKAEIADVVKRMQGRGEPSSQEAQTAQVQQQLALKTAMANIAQTEGKALESQANAKLAETKAEVLAQAAQTDPQQAMLSMSLSAQKVKAGLATAMAKNSTALALADKHISGKLQDTLIKAANGRATASEIAAIEHRKLDESSPPEKN